MNPLRAVLLLAAVLLFTGCADYEKFTRIRASNHRNEMIAEWVARGRIVPMQRGGYRILAVERISAPPYSEATRYPDGWRTTVQGAHIWHWPCAKPAWLSELEDESSAPFDVPPERQRILRTPGMP